MSYHFPIFFQYFNIPALYQVHHKNMAIIYKKGFHILTKTLAIRLMFIVLISFFLLPQLGCTANNKYTVKVHKPKKRYRPYDHQKNRGTKRLKTVKMKN